MDLSLENRVRVNSIALAIPLLSQGIPFLQMGDDLLRSKSLDRNSYDAGDWFNFVDFSKESNNWNVGLPLAQDNSANWATIAAVATKPNTKAGADEIHFSSDVFNEFLQIRKSSPLFRLTTGQDVMDRVGFHNIGKNLTAGLIVMSIDDGTGLTDLDPEHDAVVVVINGTSEQQSHKVATAKGFVLHPVQQGSADSMVQDASFAEAAADGTFTVPAYTAAVFVKPQNGTQGEGLKADATMGAADIPPYGLTTVYVRGAMNGWGEVDAMSYDGDGIYSVSITIAAGDYEFKVASADWSTVDFGSSAQQVSLGTAKTLSRGAANLKISLPKTSTYTFTVNAANPEAPQITVTEYVPYGATTVYLRGSMNGWSENNALQYEGAGLYSVTVNLAATDHEFKIASADWATVDFGSADQTVTLGADKTLSRGASNLKLNIAEQADYKVSVNATNPAAPVLKVTKVQ